MQSYIEVRLYLKKKTEEEEEEANMNMYEKFTYRNNYIEYTNKKTTIDKMNIQKKSYIDFFFFSFYGHCSSTRAKC